VSCGEGICRTPGFWGTHAREDGRSQNITQAVIEAGGGSLEVCGECIDSTVPIDNAASAIEAICVNPAGNIKLQNVRQLTAMALNCVISGFGADCGGNSDLDGLFTDCNNACLGNSSTRTNAQCRDEIDCFNNGGSFSKGACTPGGEDNCHNRPLVNESLDLNFEPPGPAGSEGDCNAAKTTNGNGNGKKGTGTECTVIPPGESKCKTDSCP